MVGMLDFARDAEGCRHPPFGSVASATARTEPVGTVASYSDGQRIYSDGQRASRIYEVERGAVRVCHTLADGRRQILAFHLPGEWFGFEANNVHRFSAEAIGNTSLRGANLPGGADFPWSLFSPVLRNLALAEQHQLVIGRSCACERVGAFLIEMAERQGRPASLTLMMSRTDIADYLGLTNETVSRSFSKLRARGIVRLHGISGVEIAKWNALMELCA